MPSTTKPAHHAARKAPPIPPVPRWSDWLSGLQERHPQLFVRLADWETRLLADRLAAIRIRHPVFITGLARAGTTILLELLARHPELGSHRYRDFPPLFTPVLWDRFIRAAGGTRGALQERAHGDRISVGPESPEAFEEVIWMAFFDSLHDPTRNAVLDSTTRNPAFERFHREHLQKMLLVRQRPRYLAKANYHITRLRYLLNLYPDASFLLVVRDPVWHIASLMKQQRLFSDIHRRDGRTQRHMSRSGHFEFGLDRRAIHIGDDEASLTINRLWAEGQEVAGWARYWCELHNFLAWQLAQDDAVRAATLVVSYDHLCQDADHRMRQILGHCDLTEDAAVIAEACQRLAPPSYYRADFSEEDLELIRRETALAHAAILQFAP